MKFKVTEFKDGKMTVVYGDGSYAHIQARADDTKAMIGQLIHEFAPKNMMTEDKFPFPLNQDEDLDDYQSGTIQEPDETFATIDYRLARQRTYPSLGTQFDALYWAREGDDSKQKAVDDQIKAIKERYPKDMKPFTQKEWIDEIKLSE
tara:strand:+ start:133 stop:576 length:444 start_codon:yes stop_codon:yes gene_type:complete